MINKIEHDYELGGSQFNTRSTPALLVPAAEAFLGKGSDSVGNKLGAAAAIEAQALADLTTEAGASRTAMMVTSYQI
jgi:hypothetical protein